MDENYEIGEQRQIEIKKEDIQKCIPILLFWIISLLPLIIDFHNKLYNSISFIGIGALIIFYYLPKKNTPDERWDYFQLILALGLGFILQCTFRFLSPRFPRILMEMALYLDAVIIARIILSLILREQNNTWRFYRMLCYTSVVWLEIAFAIMAPILLK